MKNVADLYELSPMQHGMLFDSVTTGDSGMYLIQLEYVFEGQLDATCFERAWQAVLAHHPVLRTSFHWEELEKPLQVVHTEVPFTLHQEDLSALPEDQRLERVRAHVQAERQRGMEFGQAPLLRLSLLDLGHGQQRLLWTFHHIILEGWSASMVLAEVLQAYQALRQGRPVELPAHPSYRDYIAWLVQQDPAQAEAYWRQELAGFRTPTHLDVDLQPTRLHEPVREYDGRSRTLSRGETDALKELAARLGLTLNTVVQGAFALLLARYSRQQDVVFGTIVSGRSAPIPEVERIVGLFVNLLPSRVRLDPTHKVSDWLKDLQARQVRQRAFESSRLVQVKESSEVPPGLPLFEALLVFENWHGSLVDQAWDEGLVVRDVVGHHGAPGYPLTAVIIPAPELVLGLSYDCTRFEQAAVDRLLDSLQTILVSLTWNPEQTVGDVEWVSAEERDTVLRGAHNLLAPMPQRTVLAGFRQQAAATPDAVAVEGDEASLTYAALDQESDALAARLRGHRVQRGHLVGLCLHREASALSALLAIWKVGAAYVPLDPAYPEERLKYLVEDSDVRVVITRDALRGRIPLADTDILSLDQAGPAAVPGEASDPEVPDLDDTAYVIYTSGSTGQPKGVVIGHRSLANYVKHARRAFDLTDQDRMLQFASLSFDAAAEEIYPTLLAGGTVVLRNDPMLSSAATFLDACEQRRITVLDLPTAYWHVLVDAIADGAVTLPAGVRLVILGGERVRPEKYAQWRAKVGKEPRLLNTYGPTESTIVATAADLGEEALAGDSLEELPIGLPVQNVKAYVVDAALRPVPTGVTGELLLGGEGLALGYLGRPDLTAAQFLADPFDPTPGRRVYRTGDLVRRREDGMLVFAGRVDHQVKFRGYRIELEEIENALADHEGVRESVVLLREDDPGRPLLAAYLLLKEPAPAVAELKSFLKQGLPGYMVPSHYVVLRHLPLNTHGKVERTELPVPGAEHAPATLDHAAPTTDTEQALAKIFREALKVQEVGRHDNFFDLGGHSLLLMTVVAAIEKELGVRLGPADLVRPTLAQLAVLCEERRQGRTTRPKGLLGRLFGPRGENRP